MICSNTSNPPRSSRLLFDGLFCTGKRQSSTRQRDVHGDDFHNPSKKNRAAMGSGFALFGMLISGANPLWCCCSRNLFKYGISFKQTPDDQLIGLGPFLWTLGDTFDGFFWGNNHGNGFFLGGYSPTNHLTDGLRLNL